MKPNPKQTQVIYAVYPLHRLMYGPNEELSPCVQSSPLSPQVLQQTMLPDLHQGVKICQQWMGLMPCLSWLVDGVDALSILSTL